MQQTPSMQQTLGGKYLQRTTYNGLYTPTSNSSRLLGDIATLEPRCDVSKSQGSCYVGKTTVDYPNVMEKFPV